MKKVIGFCINFAAVAAALSLCRPALAHDEGRYGVTFAELAAPRGIEHAIDDRYTIAWNDGDGLTASPAATIDFFYTAQNPPTFMSGHAPPELEGTTIVIGVSVRDAANAFVWDTTAVRSGAYWIWTRVDDPAVASSKEKSISFSAGVVIVAHRGDPQPNAVVLVAPKDPFVWPPSNSIEIEYLAFDPDGSAVVHIAARPSFDPSPGMVTIAGHLPADAKGHFLWDTTGLPEGEWTLRATIIDRRGVSFVAYDRYFRFVNHPEANDHAESGCTGVRACGAEAASGIDLVVLALFAILLHLRLRAR